MNELIFELKAVMEKYPDSKEFSAVFYTDGGCNGNVGGFGFHGYIYDENPTKTKSGSSSNPCKTKYLSSVKDDQLRARVLAFIDGYGYDETTNTNNRAELQGMIECLRLCMNLNLKRIYLLADSQYVIRLIERKDVYSKNGFKKADGKELTNVDLIKEMFAVHETLTAECEFNIDWVEGHSGEYGNDLADRNATKACFRHFNEQQAKAVIDEKRFIYNIVDPEIKQQLARPSKLFTENVLFFTTNNQEVFPDIYLQASFGKKAASKSGDKKKQTRGKPFSDACVSVIKLNQPDELINSIKKTVCDNFRDTGIIETDLVKLARPSIYTELKENGIEELRLDRNKNRLTIYGKSQSDISSLIFPPRLAWNLIDSFNALGHVLHLFIEEDFSLFDEVKDITDLIYHKKELKKGTSLEVIQTEESYIDIPVKSDGLYKYDTTVRLKFGIDLPDIPSLKNLKDINPNIRLFTWSTDAYGFRFATCITTNEGIGIWCGIYSNLQLT